MFDRSDYGPMTVLLIVLTAIVVLVGGAVVIVHPDTLTFQQYLDALKTTALAVAGTAVGRGILGAGKHVADGQTNAAALIAAPHPSPPDVVHDDVPPAAVFPDDIPPFDAAAPLPDEGLLDDVDLAAADEPETRDPHDLGDEDDDGGRDHALGAGFRPDAPVEDER